MTNLRSRAHLLLTAPLLCLFTRGEWVSQQELFALPNFRLMNLLPGLSFIIVLHNPDLAKNLLRQFNKEALSPPPVLVPPLPPPPSAAISDHPGLTSAEPC